MRTRYASASLPMRKYQPPRKVTPDQVEAAVTMYQAGASLGVIASQYGVSRPSVYDLLRRRIVLRTRPAAAALTRKPVTAIRAKRAATSRRYRQRAQRILVVHMRAVRQRDVTCRGCGTAGTDFDHIVPVSMGGQTVMENLQLLCRSCHREKSRQDVRRFWDHKNGR